MSINGIYISKTKLETEHQKEEDKKLKSLKFNTRDDKQKNLN